jgi:Phage Mu protein F like protein
VAWWNPQDLPNMAALRPECYMADWAAILSAGQGQSEEPPPTGHVDQVSDYQTPGSVSKGRSGAERRARRKAREWLRAGLPFAKAADRPPLSSRPLHAQLERAEDHHAEQLRPALAGSFDPHAIAAAWLAQQPVSKAAAPVATDLRQAALAFLRGLRPSLSGLADLLRSIYRDGWQLGVGAALAAAGRAGFKVPDSGVDWSAWRPGNQPAAQAAEGLAELLQRADVVIQGVNDNTLQAISGVLAESAAAGDSVDTTARALRDVLDDPDHARVIAHTELARAVGAASLDTYAFNDIPGKSWLTYQPCPICEANEEAGAIKLDASFPSGDDAPPAHPNCRCSLVPERLSSEEAT